MKVGIMQPYFLPYLGYWQLINAVDKYVIYDDVNFINRGWINRNYILADGKKQFIRIALKEASQNKLINEIEIFEDYRNREKLLRTIELAYKKAKCFESVMPMVEEIIRNDNVNLGEFLRFQIGEVCRYLDIKTEIIVSSTIKKDIELHGQDKIIDICEQLGADEYWNAIGGISLYSKNSFRERGIELKFMKTKEVTYKQMQNEEFVSNLSIVDVLMNVEKKEVQHMLNDYDIVTKLG